MAKQLGDAFVRVRPDTTGFGQEADHNIGGVLKKIAAGAAALFAASKIKNFLDQATTGWRDHLKVAAVTQRVIQTTGRAAHIGAAGVERLSNAIEAKTGVDGDQIQSGANLLLTFTNVQNKVGQGNKIFSRSTALLADMSVALGQSTKSSAIQLGKALNDPIKGVTALQRVGVSFTEDQKKQIKTLVDSGHTLEAQKLILHELGKEFGGAAKAAADPADRAAVAYRNLSDMVGAQTLPVVQALQRAFADRLAPVLTNLGQAILPKVSTWLVRLIDSISAGDINHATASFSGFSKGLQSVDWSQVNSGATNLVSAVKQLGPALGQTSAKAASDSLNVFAVIAKFAADHTDLLAKALPVIVAGLAAYKIGQLAANIATIAAIPTKIADVIITRQLTLATRELTASRGQLAATITAGTATENVGILTRLRSTVTTIASTVAQKAAAAASKAWAAAQWVLNAALTANPIGLVIAAIAALVVGFVIAYKKSETFRNIVNGAFQAVARVVTGAVRAVVGFVRAHWGLLVAIIAGPIGAAVVLVIRNWSRIRGATAAAWGAISGAVRSGVSRMMGIVTGIPGKISAVFSGAATMLFSAGQNIVHGLISGIRSIGGQISDTLVGLLPGPLKKFAHKLGIASPSKVFHKFGHWTGQGFINGIVGTRDDVTKAFEDIVKQLNKKTDASIRKLVLSTRRRLAALGDVYGSVTDQLKDATDKLSSLRDEASGYASSIKDSITGTGDLTGFGSTFKGLISGLTKANTNAETFTQTIAQLTTAGLNQAGLQQLVAKGVDALPIAQAILKAGPSGVAQVNALQSKLNDTATRLGNSVSATMYDAGVQAAQGLVDGLASQQAAIAAQMTAIATAMVKKTRHHLKIKSPSRVFREIGQFTGQGMALGVKDTHAAVAAAVRGLVPTDGFDSPGGRTGGRGRRYDGPAVVQHVYDKSGSPRQTARESARYLAAAGIG